METKYKRSSEFIDKDAYTLSPLEINEIKIPKGTFGRIIERNGDLLKLRLNKCYCCGVQVVVWINGKYLEFANGVTEEDLIK